MRLTACVSPNGVGVFFDAMALPQHNATHPTCTTGGARPGGDW